MEWCPVLFFIQIQKQLAKKWQEMSSFLTTGEETKSNKHRQHVAHAEDIVQDVGGP